MGHKVHPKIFRMQVIYKWPSRWFAKLNKEEYRKNLKQDIEIRESVRKQCKDAGVDEVKIERDHSGEITITLTVAKPGIIIGRGGSGVEDLTKKLEKDILKGKNKIRVNIQEIKQPNLSARIVGMNMAADLEKRMPYRRVMKQALDRVEKAGAKGVRVMVAGRLNGADIARKETLSRGKIPLQNLRADIDYARIKAHTIYGVIGIKVWIYKGEVFDK